MSSYVVIWKNAESPLISTTADMLSSLVIRDDAYLERHGIPVLGSEQELHVHLKRHDGAKAAVTTEMAHDLLGWDID